MSIYYKVFQSNRKNSPTNGKWYGRAAMIETDSIDDLAKRIQEKCTVNEADVLAVIKALISEMTRSLQSSHRVKFPGFGTFKLGISSKPAEKKEDFSASLIKNVHVLFTPELRKSQDGNSTRTFVNGVRLKAFSSLENAVVKSDNGTSGTDKGTDKGTDAGTGAGGSEGSDA